MRFHIQQESDIPASTQLYNQICFAIAARHFPPGHRLPSTRQLAMQTGLHRNTISKVYRQLENDGVVEAMAGSGIYVRDQQKPREVKAPSGPRHRIRPDIDQEVRRSIDGLLNAGCTLQQARELLTREIDWRLRCGARVLVSTPREDLGASLLIAEELTPKLEVPVEVVPLEELEAVLESSNNGTVVTSRYFLQPVEELAKQHGVRAVAVDLNDFRQELAMLKECAPAVRWPGEHQPWHPAGCGGDPALDARPRAAGDDRVTGCGQPLAGPLPRRQSRALRPSQPAAGGADLAAKSLATDASAAGALRPELSRGQHDRHALQGDRPR